MDSPSSQQTPPPFLEPSNLVGTVTDGSISTVKVTMAPPDPSSDAESCQPGDYLLIPAGKMVIFGQANGICLEEQPDGTRLPVAVVALLNTLDFATGSVSPGVARRPTLGAPAYLASSPVVRMVAEARSKKGGKSPKVSLDLARLADVHNTPIMITPEMLFGRHMAILGTTGGGKSYTLTRLVEEVAKHRSKTILLDPSGEFGSIESGALHVYLGDHPDPPPHLHPVSMPYWELTENDLFAIFKPTGEAQSPKLRQAIKTLKLAKLAPHIALGGVIAKANRSKKTYEDAYQEHVHALEGQGADFEIALLVRQISNECIFANRSATEPQSWGDINQAEISLVVPLMNRIQDITTSGNLSPIFQPGDRPSLFRVIDEFLKSDECRVLVLSLQYLSFEHSAREIVANAVGRTLMALARAERFREMPIFVAIDEAHHFLKDAIDHASEYAMDSFALIAKEGRKYGLHICIATQRPRDIPEGVLSQMGSLIVHRLINDRDRGIIERASGEANASAMSSLPILTQGQAVILGAEFPVPLLVKIQMPNKRPNARSADFQRCWAKAEESENSEKERAETEIIYL